MSRLHLHAETHLVSRIGWLRAAVLGANDGIVSTASLIVGVAPRLQGPRTTLVAGVAGLVAGAMSMAAGEYVSVSSQPIPRRPTSRANAGNSSRQPTFEREELAAHLCRAWPAVRLSRVTVADQLMAQGCTRRPCARRTRHLRNHRRPPDPGRADLGRDLLHGRRHALVDGGRVARGCACPQRVRRVLSLSRLARRDRSKSRRRPVSARDSPSDILGRAVDGVNSRHRQSIRNGRLDRPAAREASRDKRFQAGLFPSAKFFAISPPTLFEPSAMTQAFDGDDVETLRGLLLALEKAQRSPPEPIFVAVDELHVPQQVGIGDPEDLDTLGKLEFYRGTGRLSAE